MSTGLRGPFYFADDDPIVALIDKRAADWTDLSHLEIQPPSPEQLAELPKKPMVLKDGSITLDHLLADEELSVPVRVRLVNSTWQVAVSEICRIADEHASTEYFSPAQIKRIWKAVAEHAQKKGGA